MYAVLHSANSKVGDVAATYAPEELSMVALERYGER